MLLRLWYCVGVTDGDGGAVESGRASTDSSASVLDVVEGMKLWEVWRERELKDVVVVINRIRFTFYPNLLHETPKKRKQNLKTQFLYVVFRCTCRLLFIRFSGGRTNELVGSVLARSPTREAFEDWRDVVAGSAKFVVFLLPLECAVRICMTRSSFQKKAHLFWIFAQSCHQFLQLPTHYCLVVHLSYIHNTKSIKMKAQKI